MVQKRKGLLIAGASGHGRVIASLAEQIGCYKQICFLDDDVSLQKNDKSIVGTCSYAIEHSEEYEVIVAIGDAATRKNLQEKYEEAGVQVATLIHPFSSVAKDVLIGDGTVVMAGAVIQPGCRIGRGSIVNTCASLDHDNILGDFSHVAVGAHLAGNVHVGSETWIGAGAVVSNNIEVQKNVIVGAGAVVVGNIEEEGTYIGVPARKIK